MNHKKKPFVFRVRSNYDTKSNLSNDIVMDGSVPFSTVYGLKQNFKLINLSNQSLNIIPTNDKTTKNSSDELAVGRSEDVSPSKCDMINFERIGSTDSPIGLRKRNVNWNVPIRSGLLANEGVGQSGVDRFHLSEMKLDEGEEEVQNVEPLRVQNRVGDAGDREAVEREPAIDDDGFESLNGKSSSGEDNVMTTAPLSDDLTGDATSATNVNESKQSVDSCNEAAVDHSAVSSVRSDAIEFLNYFFVLPTF